MFFFCQGTRGHLKIWTSVFNSAKDGCITKQHEKRRSCATNLPSGSKCLLFPRHSFWVSTSFIFRVSIEKQGWKAFSQLKNVTTRRTWRPGGFEVRSISSNFPTLQSVEDMAECNQMRYKQIVCFLQPGLAPKKLVNCQKIQPTSRALFGWPMVCWW